MTVSKFVIDDSCQFCAELSAPLHIVTALKNVAQQIRTVEELPPMSGEDFLPGHGEHLRAKRHAEIILREADRIGVLKGWFSAMPDTFYPGEYFNEFTSFAVKQFGSNALTSPPSSLTEQWMWARELVAEAVWQVARISNAIPKKRGRPIDTNHQADAKLYDDWIATKSSRQLTIAEFASERKVSPVAAKAAIGREKGRRSQARQSK